MDAGVCALIKPNTLEGSRLTRAGLSLEIISLFSDNENKDCPREGEKF